MPPTARRLTSACADVVAAPPANMEDDICRLFTVKVLSHLPTKTHHTTPRVTPRRTPRTRASHTPRTHASSQTMRSPCLLAVFFAVSVWVPVLAAAPDGDPQSATEAVAADEKLAQHKKLERILRQLTLSSPTKWRAAQHSRAQAPMRPPRWRVASFVVKRSFCQSTRANRLSKQLDVCEQLVGGFGREASAAPGDSQRGLA